MPIPRPLLRSLLALVLISARPAASAEPPKSIPDAPPRAAGEGPFPRLILRGVTVVDGAGAPPFGPADIVIERDRITEVKVVGSPGTEIDAKKRPAAKPGDKEMDLTGMYVLPGFVDLHGHIGGVEQGTPADYVFKLWLAHGVTTVRDPGSGNGLAWVLSHKAKSDAQRDHRAAHRGLRDLRAGARGAVHAAGGGARLGRRSRQAGRRRDQVLRPPAGDLQGRGRGGRAARPAHHLPPRPALGGAPRRARLGALGPRRHGALVRPARGAVHGAQPSRTIRSTTTTPTSSTASARPAGCGGRRRRPGASAGTR